MATATLISEAQLFRYVSGDSDLPTDRLMAVAKAANVDAAWLLTGKGDMGGTTGTDPRPSFRSELMVQLIQLFEELMVEFEKSFNPRQRARAMTFLYNALRHEETVRHSQETPNKFELLKSVNFLVELRSEEELDVLNNALTLLEYTTPAEFSAQQLELLRTWVNLVVRGTKGYYSSYSGQVYFERKSGGQLEASAILDLQNIIMRASKSRSTSELDWLDLGCGSGRHLVHLAKHAPNLRLRGIELSQLGYNMCQDLMASEKIPAQSVVMGDARQLPYASDSFDVVFANLSLYSLPYISGTGLGLEEAMHEVTRVLRTNGIVKMVFPYGLWRDYSIPSQFMNEDGIAKLIKGMPFEIVESSVQTLDSGAAIAGANSAVPNQLKPKYQKLLHITLRKL